MLNRLETNNLYSANGDIIVTVLPVNQKWPWITPAEFRPELVPEELMAEGLSVMNLLFIFMSIKLSSFHLFSVDSGRLCSDYGDIGSRCQIYCL